MKLRESKFELLRIIAMMMIVLGHVFMSVNPARLTGDFNSLMWYWLGSGSRIAVNVFLMLGVWFMVDASFSARRILALYLHVILYSLPITILMLVLGYAVPIKEVFRGLMPFWGRGLWFASAYIILLFWAPFLKQAFKLPKKAQVLLLSTLFLFTCCVCTVPDPQLSYALDLFWFACMYLFIGFVKYNWPKLKQLNPYCCMGVGFAGYLIMATLQWWGARHSGEIASAVATLSYQWLVDFKTLPNLLSAFLIFLGFSNLSMKVSPLINLVAMGTFGVYILHTIPAFHPCLFRTICAVPKWARSADSWLYLFLTAVLIFIGCSIIDYFRARYLSPLYLNSGWFNYLCAKLDKLYASCGMKV